jgi:hypothetical protein
MAFDFRLEKLFSSTSGKFENINKLLTISATVKKSGADSIPSFTNDLPQGSNWIQMAHNRPKYPKKVSLENTGARTTACSGAALPISSNNPYVRQTNCIIMYITSKLCATVIECVSECESFEIGLFQENVLKSLFWFYNKPRNSISSNCKKLVSYTAIGHRPLTITNRLLGTYRNNYINIKLSHWTIHAWFFESHFER